MPKGQRQPLPTAAVRPLWAVEMEQDALVAFDTTCEALGVTREQGAREAIAWYTGRAAVWVRRRRQAAVQRVERAGDAWAPIDELLAERRELDSGVDDRPGTQ